MFVAGKDDHRSKVKIMITSLQPYPSRFAKFGRHLCNLKIYIQDKNPTSNPKIVIPSNVGSTPCTKRVS